MRLIFEPEAAYYGPQGNRGGDAENFPAGEQIEQLIQDGKDRTKEEREFHKTIARATHNEFMNRLMPIIFAAIDKGVILSEAKKEAVEDTISDHRMLMQFLKNRNAEGARYAMKIHILHAIDQLDIKK